MKFKALIQTASAFVKANSPTILTAVGLGGMLTTVVMACRATSVYQENLCDAEDLYFDAHEEEENLPKKEIAKVFAKTYWPAMVMGVGTAGCFIFANRINSKRNLALATAYQLSESTLKTYQEKVIEKIGEKQEREVRDEINQDHIAQCPPTQSTVVITGKGSTLFWDKASDRYFMSDLEYIRQQVNAFNHELLREGSATLNEFYDYIGLKRVTYGENMGWNANTRNDILEISYPAAKTSEDCPYGSEIPCLVLEYSFYPNYDFRGSGSDHAWR